MPHFEKMSYDNSELLRAYCSGVAAYGTPLYGAVARGIVAWVREVLCDPEAGAFFTSQDADVGAGDDGDYWTWTLDEARAVLDERELEVCRAVFDIEPRGEMHHNPAKNVLWLKRDPTAAEGELVDSALRKLKVDSAATWVLLDAAGKQHDSQQFARWLGGLRDRGTREVVFLCGDDFGFPDDVASAANAKLSLSPLTMPHELARVVLAEQIYRSFAILASHPYPK